MANKSIFRKSFVRLHEDILHAPPPIYDLLQPGEFLDTTFVRNDGRPYHYLDYVGSHQYSLYQADGYGAGPKVKVVMVKTQVMITLLFVIDMELDQV